MHFFLSLFGAQVAYADTAALNSFLNKVIDQIINPLILFLFALAVVYFLYGVFDFLSNQENEEKATAGKSHMMWGIIGITIMLGVYGILHLIMNTFYLKDVKFETGQVELPEYKPNYPPLK